MTYSSSSERVCYILCDSCTTMLAVSVPCDKLMTEVTVGCGQCGNVLSINTGLSLQFSLSPYKTYRNKISQVLKLG